MFSGIKIMVGMAYKRLVNNVVKFLKPIIGKKPLGHLMLACNILKKKISNTTDEDNWIQLEVNFRWETQAIKKNSNTSWFIQKLQRNATTSRQNFKNYTY